MYKIIHKDIAVHPEHLGMQQSDSRTRAKHKYKMRELPARTDDQTLLCQPHNSTVELSPHLSGGGRFCSCLQESADGAAWLGSHRPLA